MRTGRSRRSGLAASVILAALAVAIPTTAAGAGALGPGVTGHLQVIPNQPYPTDPYVGIASQPYSSGYWVVDAYGEVTPHGQDGEWGEWTTAGDGTVYAYGAPFFGSG